MLYSIGELCFRDNNCHLFLGLGPSVRLGSPIVHNLKLQTVVGKGTGNQQLGDDLVHLLVFWNWSSPRKGATHLFQ